MTPAQQLAESAGWRTIDSAPKDGTVVLVARRGMDREHKAAAPDVVIAKWGNAWGMRGPNEWLGVAPRQLDGSQYVVSLTIGGDFSSAFPDVGPTHWMPLPEPPK